MSRSLFGRTWPDSSEQQLCKASQYFIHLRAWVKLEVELVLCGTTALTGIPSTGLELSIIGQIEEYVLHLSLPDGKI
jgi:hypothetical protein